MNDPDLFRAEFLHHMGEGFDPVFREYAEKQPPGASRVGERAQQIEDGAGAEFDAGRADMLHGGMMGRGEHEPNVGLFDTSGDRGRRHVEAHTQRIQHVACT